MFSRFCQEADVRAPYSAAPPKNESFLSDFAGTIAILLIRPHESSALPETLPTKIMKNKLRLRALAILATSPLVVFSFSPAAFAGTLEWAGSSSGLATGTSDTWDADTTANWWNGSSLVNWPAPGGTDDDAVFGGTAGTVTITTVTANDITFNTTGYTLSDGTLTLNGSAPTITLGTGIDATISSVINGSSGLLKSGGGTLTLSGSNGYSGTTVVNAGTLALSGNNSNGNLQVNGTGALTRITGGTTTVASNLGDSYVTGGGTIEIDGGSLLINGGSAWFSVGDHPAIPDGDGTLTLTSGSFTNNNSWGIVVGEGNAGAGFVNINGGVFTANDTFNNSGLMLGNGAGASGTLNLNGGTLITDAIKGGPGSGTVNFNGGKLQATGDVFDIFQNNGSITTTIQSGGLKVGGTPNFAISEELGGTGALTKEDSNTVLLSGNNGYSGGTTISGGTLVAGNNAALGSGSLDMSGGTLQSGVSGATTLSNSIQINGTGNVFNAPSGFNLELNGSLTGSGTASVAGQWAVTLGGDNSGFTGTWISGSLGPDNITSFSSASSGSASAAWQLNGGRMINANGSSPTVSLGSLSGTGGILSNNTGGQVTYSVGGLNTDAAFSGQIHDQWGGGGTTAITKVGSGTWTLSGTLSYTGATAIDGGNLVIQNGANYAGMSTSGYTLGNNSKLTFYSTNNPMIDKAITGSGDLYIDGNNGAGDQWTSRVNVMSDGLKTFSGSVYVLANGKLAVWGGDGSGAIPDASVVDVAGLFTLYGNLETIGGLTGSGIVQGHNAVLTVANVTDQTFSGTLRKNPNEVGTFVLAKTASGTLTLSGTTDNGDARATIESGTLVLAKDSSGVHALGSTKTNALTINGGTCRLDGLGSDQIYDLSNVHMAGGTFDLNGREEGFFGLSGSAGNITNNSVDFARVVVGVGSLAGEVSTFAGSIQDGTGQVGLTKTGSGTLVLTGTSSYTDFTTVNGGALKIDGSLGNTEVYVSSAVLAGNGSIGGTVYIDNGGNLATRISDWTGIGGSGFEDLSVQSLVLTTGTPHVITVDTTGLVNFSESAATFPIVLTTGGISGFSATDFSVSAPGFAGTGTWAVQVNGTNTNLELVYSPAVASAYDTWATAKGLTGANNGKTQDPDDDGLTNLQEFAFDGNPLSGTNDGKRFTGIADPDGAGPESDALLLTIAVRDGAVFNGPGDLVSDPVDDVVYRIQGSLELTDWTSVNVSEVTPAYTSGLPSLSSGWSYRTFRTPGPIGSPNVRSFLRSGVSVAP